MHLKKRCSDQRFAGSAGSATWLLFTAYSTILREKLPDIKKPRLSGFKANFLKDSQFVQIAHDV